MSYDVLNIGIFPCEAENAFELSRSLKYAPRFNVIGLASSACQSYFEFEKVRDNLPFMHEDGFLEAFSRVLEEENIAYVFPSHDSVALFLKQHETLLPAQVLCSGLEVARFCRDKFLFYDSIYTEAFCPHTYHDIKDISKYPVFLKPRDGQGGQGCLKVNSEFELKNFFDTQLQNSSSNNIIISEYLSGEEYTLDCFTDRHGKLLFCGARSRDVIKLGMSFICPTVLLTDEMKVIAERLNQLLVPKGLRGLWFFQLKKNAQGVFKILEVSTRVAGTMALYRQRGINFAQLTLFDALGFDVSILDNQNHLRLSRSIHACYENDVEYDTVFMDLDDTLIVRGNVNLLALLFLYQCVNNHKKLYLLTRHEGEIVPYLQQFRIAENLFEQIIHIHDDSKKSYHIDKICEIDKTTQKAIFIDNLFVERKEVQEKLGIPVFDVDAIECLLEAHI